MLLYWDISFELGHLNCLLSNIKRCAICLLLQHRTGLNDIILSRLHPVLVFYSDQYGYPVTHFTRVFSGTFAILSGRLTVCLSVRPHGTTELRLHEFSWNLIFEYCSKMPRKCGFLENLTRITGTLHEDLLAFIVISRWILLKMRNFSDSYYRENQNTHLFRKSFHLRDNMEKYGTAIEATHENTAHAHYIPDN